MNRVSFKSILHGVATRLGLDPTANLTAPQAAAITEYIDDHLGRAWDIYPWPETVKEEQRPFYATYVPGTTYAIGDLVFDPVSSLYYTALTADAGEHQFYDATHWQQTIGYETMGQVLEVFQPDPCGGLLRAIPYRLQGDAIYISNCSTDPLTVRYQTLTPHVTSVAWDAAKTYAIGDLVYFDAAGDCFTALTPNTDIQPDTSPDDWALQEIPARLGSYLKAASYADGLREDGQTQKADDTENRAESQLESEMAKLGIHQHQTARYSPMLA